MDLYTIQNHLSLNGFKDGNYRTWESSLVIALRDARIASGRNKDTGEIIDQTECGYPGSWLGAIGYLTVLDLIGKTYKPTNATPQEKKNPIVDALIYFGGLNDNDAYAIYALRCSLTHDYTLINFVTNPQKKDLLNHIFEVNANKGNNQLVILREIVPTNFTVPINKKCITKVNLRALGDKVEEIYLSIISLNVNNKIKLIIDIDSFAKYFWCH